MYLHLLCLRPPLPVGRIREKKQNIKAKHEFKSNNKIVCQSPFPTKFLSPIIQLHNEYRNREQKHILLFQKYHQELHTILKQ